MLGVSLSEGTGGIALLAAIFAANFPEALVGSASMRAQGRSNAFILGVWTICAVLLVFAVVIDRTAGERNSGNAFAAAGLRRKRSPRRAGGHDHAGGL